MISFYSDRRTTNVDRSVRATAPTWCAPAAHRSRRSGAFPERVVQAGWELGILPGSIPERLGGFAEEYSALTGALAYEELAYGDLALALQVMAPALVAVPLMLAGTDEQRAQGIGGNSSTRHRCRSRLRC